MNKIMYEYKGAPIFYRDFEKIFTAFDTDLTNKNECICYLKNIQEMLKAFLKKNKYPTQYSTISLCINNINMLINTIELNY